ncbi:two-component system sensor histidine kinase [Dokdonia sp. MED134]|uniref:sensor histidine kinase n=1 Tax=Dokdonia sp. MED134 TaxID=313590 RepID=UPI000068A827|nr:HAMP domain-containing sensor histidine kinase [Dokdonia sp. MED134]EAQ37666.1 two-component system sensor histidine kinase [Dokdonia sp. MED134]
MKSKFSLLIAISALALLALCAIQAYLISNTYELKKTAFFNETSNAVSEIANDRELDSLYDALIEVDLEDHLADYFNESITKRQVVERFYRNADTYNEQYMKRYEALQLQKELGYEVAYRQNLLSIVIIDYPNTDTIFPIKDNERKRIFGQKFKTGISRSINYARTFDTNEFIDRRGDSISISSYDFEVRTTQEIQVPNWKSLVLKRMWVLIVGSIILFLFVIGLLYYSIKNLITQKKIAEVKTDFINNVTHELKTPLATLGIATKSLRNEAIKSNPDSFNNTLGIVERQNSRLQKLIDQVLTNSLSAEELQLNKEQVSDNVFFKNLLSDFEIATQHAHLTVLNKVYSPEVLLRIDRFHLTTALLNVLENAVKYGKDQVTVTVTTRLVNRNYCIEISDNGTGISPADQKAIFDKFYRAGNSDVHNVKGLGLGLYFTHQIITAHGGTITLKSIENEGSTFTIKLPL